MSERPTDPLAARLRETICHTEACHGCKDVSRDPDLLACEEAGACGACADRLVRAILNEAGPEVVAKAQRNSPYSYVTWPAVRSALGLDQQEAL